MRNYTARFIAFPKMRNLFLLFLALAAITACKKDEDTTPKTSNLMFINAIPDVPTMDLYIDKKVAASNIAFGSSTPYVEVPAGKHLITTTAPGSIDPKVNADLTFDPEKRSTVIGYSSNAKPESVLVADTTLTPSAGKVWIRYINLSPVTANTTYVLETAGGTGLYDLGANFRTASKYKEYDAGAFSFEAYNIHPQAGTQDPVASTGVFSFEGGKIYSLILIGTQGATAPMNLTLKAVANQ